MIHGWHASHNGKRYMSRYYLKGNGEGKSWELYLHRIYRPDADARPHNHPWGWFLSLVLWGWYEEKRYWGSTPRGPFLHYDRTKVRWWNFLAGDNTFHRISEVSKRPVWTLVLVPKREKPRSDSSWGYASAIGFIPHETAHKAINGVTEKF